MSLFKIAKKKARPADPLEKVHASLDESIERLQRSSDWLTASQCAVDDRINQLTPVFSLDDEFKGGNGNSLKKKKVGCPYKVEPEPNTS